MTPLPPNVSIAAGLQLLRDFDFVVRLSPDCRCYQRIPAPAPETREDNVSGEVTTYYEVQDDLPFIPKRLWSGGVKYQAAFRPTPEGCRITVHAPGGFTSTNEWRLLPKAIPGDGPAGPDLHSEDVDYAGRGRHVMTVSEGQVNKTFAPFVTSFLVKSHQTQQNAFIEALENKSGGEAGGRPTLGPRQVSEFETNGASA